MASLLSTVLVVEFSIILKTSTLLLNKYPAGDKYSTAGASGPELAGEGHYWRARIGLPSPLFAQVQFLHDSTQQSELGMQVHSIERQSRGCHHSVVE